MPPLPLPLASEPPHGRANFAAATRPTLSLPLLPIAATAAAVRAYRCFAHPLRVCGLPSRVQASQCRRFSVQVIAAASRCLALAVVANPCRSVSLLCFAAALWRPVPLCPCRELRIIAALCRRTSLLWPLLGAAVSLRIGATIALPLPRDADQHIAAASLFALPLPSHRWFATP